MKYWARKDELIAEVNKYGLEIGDELYLIYYLPIPPSWSKKKRAAMLGQKHQQRPDCDNITKFFKDALLEEDCTVWREWAEKRWGEEGYIEVYNSMEAYLKAIEK
jgi:Holliday junction resolvase RusA-like endonuclease